MSLYARDFRGNDENRISARRVRDYYFLNLKRLKGPLVTYNVVTRMVRSP